MQHPGQFVEFAKYLERHDFEAIPPADHYWPTHTAAIKGIHGRFRIGSYVDPDNQAMTVDILVDDIWYTKDCCEVPFWDFTVESAHREGERLILQLREVVYATRDYAKYVLGEPLCSK